jgi:hypothetical protein
MSNADAALRPLCLQIFKFAVYLGVPISLTAFVAFRPDNLQAIIQNVGDGRTPASISAKPPQRTTLTAPLMINVQRSYVRYPPEGERPPNWDELQALLAKERQSKK